MHKQQLIQLPLDDGRLFYCLEEFPSSVSKDRAVIFLHGLGENRAGLNYLFSELGEGLRRGGFATYRFDLGGCGESMLPLSIAIWKRQLETVLAFTQSYKKVHVVARGVSSVLLPAGGGRQVAIGPIRKEQITKQLSQLAMSQENWIISKRGAENREEEAFWYSMGVEAGCLFWGPFTSFMQELQSLINPISERWNVIYGGSEESSLPSSACYLPECHPLFLYQADRQILLKELAEILND